MARGADDRGDAASAPSAERPWLCDGSINPLARARSTSVCASSAPIRNAAATSSGPSSGLSDDTSSVSSTGSSTRRSRSINANLAACVIALAGASPFGRCRRGDRGPQQERQPGGRHHQCPNDLVEVVGLPVFRLRPGRPRTGSVRRVTPRGSPARSRWRMRATAGRWASGSAAITTVDAGSRHMFAEPGEFSSSSRCASSITTATRSSSSARGARVSTATSAPRSAVSDGRERPNSCRCRCLPTPGA